MYMGGGIGLNINFDGYASIPVFLDMKYNIFDWTLSPYLDCRVGMEVLSAGDYLAFMALPGVCSKVNFPHFRLEKGTT